MQKLSNAKDRSITFVFAIWVFVCLAAGSAGAQTFVLTVGAASKPKLDYGTTQVSHRIALPITSKSTGKAPNSTKLKFSIQVSMTGPMGGGPRPVPCQFADLAVGECGSGKSEEAELDFGKTTFLFIDTELPDIGQYFGIIKISYSANGRDDVEKLVAFSIKRKAGADTKILDRLRVLEADSKGAIATAIDGNLLKLPLSIWLDPDRKGGDQTIRFKTYVSQLKRSNAVPATTTCYIETGDGSRKICGHGSDLRRADVTTLVPGQIAELFVVATLLEAGTYNATVVLNAVDRGGVLTASRTFTLTVVRTYAKVSAEFDTVAVVPAVIGVWDWNSTNVLLRAAVRAKNGSTEKPWAVLRGIARKLASGDTGTSADYDCAQWMPPKKVGNACSNRTRHKSARFDLSANGGVHNLDLYILGLRDPGVYSAIISLVADGREPVSQTVSISVKRDWWSAALVIAIGILAGYMLRYWRGIRRPMLIQLRNLADLRDRIRDLQDAKADDLKRLPPVTRLPITRLTDHMWSMIANLHADADLLDPTQIKSGIDLLRGKFAFLEILIDLGKRIEQIASDGQLKQLRQEFVETVDELRRAVTAADVNSQETNIRKLLDRVGKALLPIDIGLETVMRIAKDQPKGAVRFLKESFDESIKYGDAIYSFAIFVVAVIFGLSVWWVDQPTWGTSKDLIIALLWGLGFEVGTKSTFGGIRALGAKYDT